MSIIKKYIEYLKDNPHGYRFKRKLYGWGWVPVKWQGWLVILSAVIIIIATAYEGEVDDAPGLILLGFIVGVAIIFIFGYWKGEKPKWMWGLPKEENNNEIETESRT